MRRRTRRKLQKFIIHKNRITLILVFMLSITIGFSAFATTLSFVGTAIVKGGKYTVTIGTENAESSVPSVDIKLNGSGKVTITPTSGYYLASGECTNGGYVIAGMETGLTATGPQEITIQNTAGFSNTTCTFVAKRVDASQVGYTNSADSSIQTVDDALDKLYSIYN